MKIVSIILLVVAILICIMVFERDRKSKISNNLAFEAGAHLIALHHKIYGNYGSQAMRGYVFKNYLSKGKMPQTEEEMREIVDIVDELYSKDFRNIKEKP